MEHNKIFVKFKEILPMVGKEVKHWVPNRKNSILITIEDDGKKVNNFVFTYVSNTEWRLETVDNFINNEFENERRKK